MVDRVYVCRGGDCRKAKGFARLLELLGTVETVRCQKICKGPVVGLELNGRVEWFARVGSKKRREALLEILETGRLPERLRKLRSSKRSGKRRS